MPENSRPSTRNIESVSAIPPLIATSVVRGSEQGQSHGGIYIVDPASQTLQQMLDWNTVDIDWSGRGLDWGLRGIAFWGGEVYVAANRIIEHFDMGRYFAKVYGCELDGTRANKADLLSFAIDENPGAVSRTMIGDREHDLIAATANHMIPVGVSYGYGSVEELEIAGAASIAASPGELPGLLA